MPRKAKEPKSGVPSGFDGPTANDDLYVNQGESYDLGLYYPAEDPARVEAEAAEKGMMAQSYPVIENVFEWFKEQAELAGRNSNVQTDVLTINGVQVSRQVSIEAQVFAYRLLESLLVEKANEFNIFAEGLE